MPFDFDLNALQQAVEAQRQERGLSWAQVARETGVSASTVRAMQNDRVVEGDGVLSILRWLGRSPESFTPRADRQECRLPEVADGAGVLRFNSRAIYAALESRREELGMTWRQLAIAIGLANAAGLTYLRNGGRVSFPSIMRILAWLDEPASRYTHITHR